MRVFLIVSFVSVFSTACVSTGRYRVTFDSVPQGATLICNNKNWGYTPVNLYYKQVGKTIDASKCRAVWSSGAEKEYSNNLTVYPRSSTIATLKRPGDVPGYSQDAEFELKVKAMQMNKKRAVLDERKTIAEERKAAAQEKRAKLEEQKMKNKQTKKNKISIW